MWLRMIIIACLIGTWTAAAARGATTVSARLLEGTAVREGGFSSLVVSIFVPPGGGILRVKDVRGGVEVSRSISADLANQTAQILVPLPSVEMDALKDNTWPLAIRLDQATSLGADAAVEKETIVRVALPTTEENTERVFRIAEPSANRGLSWNAEPPFNNDTLRLIQQEMRSDSVGIVRVGDDDVLTGPALALAGCDAVLLRSGMATTFTEDRLLSLMNAGIHVLFINEEQPAPIGAPLGGTARFSWHPLLLRTATAANKIGIAPLWEAGISNRSVGVRNAAPVAFLRPPRVVEPSLADVQPLKIVAIPDAHVRTLTLVSLAGAAALLVLTRLITRRWWVATVIIATGVSGISISAVLYLQAMPSGAFADASWITFAGSPSTPLTATSLPASVSLVGLSETLTAISPLFAQHLQRTGSEGEILYPIVADARAYFALHDAHLQLDSASVLDNVQQFDAIIPARGRLLWMSRYVTVGEEAHPDLWVAAGHTFKSQPNTKTVLTSGEPLNTFTAEAATNATSLQTWYALEFQARDTWAIGTLRDDVHTLAIWQQR